MTSDARFAIVLAAGQGTRLSALTTDAKGMVTPKQFCSLRDGPTLLEAALIRAEQLVPRERILVVVAAEHAHHWRDQLSGWPPANVIVQPRNRGTAVGLLLPILVALFRHRDPSICVLPSDHYVRDEDVLAGSMDAALASVERGDSGIVLLGIAPSSPTADYGWIVPAGNDAGIQRVQSFVEKPDQSTAARLMREGALWNSFLLAVGGRAMLDCIDRCLPALARELREAILLGGDALARCYDTLATADLSRDVLQRRPEELRLLRVPPCGWTDLGTPERVTECLALRHGRRAPSARLPCLTPHLSLERQLVRSALRASSQLRVPSLARSTLRQDQELVRHW